VIEPREWTEDLLLSLPHEEHDWLEVKGRKALDLTAQGVDENTVRMSLSKAICAFANSGGGTLVLGMAITEAGWKVDDGGISQVIRRPSTKEWLEDTIPHLVDPRLRTFNVTTVGASLSASSIETGRAIYVLEIADSQTAPHQALDNKYYGRVAGKSRPLSHQFVLDIMNRRQLPIVSLSFSISARREGQRHLFSLSPGGALQEQRMPGRKVTLNCEALNSGKVLANYVSCHVRLPAAMTEAFGGQPRRTLELDGAEYIELVRKNTRRDVTGYDMTGPSQYGPSWFDPILPQLGYTWDWDVSSDFRPAGFTGMKIHWTAYADNAPAQNGEVLISEVPYSDNF
jgi:hypothetical protein